MPLVLCVPKTRPWGSPNLSPFCSKLEVYLRMRAIPFERKEADMRKTPKGKIPYVEFEDGSRVGDSQLIIDRLEKAPAAGAALDAHLDADQRATCHVVRRMLDEAVYFVLVHSRWIPDEAFATLRPEFEKVLPGPVRMLMPLIRRSVRKTLHSQGTGRHTREEIEAVGKADWDSLARILGDKPYLFGESPSTADASLYAMVAGCSRFPLESPIKSALLAHANLVAYRDRIEARYFADGSLAPS